MGHEVEKVLIERGHEIYMKVDAGDDGKLPGLAGADAAIEFSTPGSAFDNVAACLRAGIPVVCGTTGWNDRIEEAKCLCNELNGTFFWSSNFSIGVNVMFAVNSYLAAIMNRFDEYVPAIVETHHVRKKDAPSGTAVTLAEEIVRNIARIERWTKADNVSCGELSVTSIRKGDIPGIHEITYDSPADTITLRHSAKNRQGFALGAVLAAEYAMEHSGVLTMGDMLGIK